MSRILAASRARVFVALAAAVIGLAGLSASLARTPTSRPGSTASSNSLTESGGPAARPGSGSARPGARIENLAIGLRLDSARVDRLNLHDTDEEYAVYHFARFVHDIERPEGFRLVGFDTDSVVSARDARLVTDDPTSVLAGFAPGTDLARYSLATVAVNTVEDESGRGNLPSSATLGGSTLGSSPGAVTDDPDLVGAEAIPTLNRVVYTYDEQLDPNSTGDATRFGYYTSDGHMVPATAIVTTVDNTVIAQFGHHTEDGALLYAKGGAVRNRAGKQSTVGAIGRPTTAPNLAGVSGPVGRSQFDFTFDQPVTDVDVAKFVLYGLDGSPYPARGFVRPSVTVVRVSIPQLQKFAGQMALAAVEDGAVKSNDGSDTPGTIGARRIGALTLKAGVTAAPDLVATAVDTDTGEVRFGFDQAVDDDRPYDASDFSVVSPAGDLVPGRFVAETAGNEVLVAFDRNVAAAARGVAIDDGAVQDFQGKKSPPQLLLTGVTPGPGPVTGGGTPPARPEDNSSAGGPLGPSPATAEKTRYRKPRGRRTANRQARRPAPSTAPEPGGPRGPAATTGSDGPGAPNSPAPPSTSPPPKSEDPPNDDPRGSGDSLIGWLVPVTAPTRVR